MSTEKVGEKDNKKYFSRFLEAPLLRQVDGKLKKKSSKIPKGHQKKIDFEYYFGNLELTS